MKWDVLWLFEFACFLFSFLFSRSVSVNVLWVICAWWKWHNTTEVHIHTPKTLLLLLLTVVATIIKLASNAFSELLVCYCFVWPTKHLHYWFHLWFFLQFAFHSQRMCRLQILNAKMVRCTIVDSWHANIKETQWIYDICFSFLPENIHFQNCSVVFMLFLWNKSLICCFRFLLSQFYCR